jgi:hypothetical protein
MYDLQLFGVVLSLTSFPTSVANELRISDILCHSSVSSKGDKIDKFWDLSLPVECLLLPPRRSQDGACRRTSVRNRNCTLYQIYQTNKKKYKVGKNADLRMFERSEIVNCCFSNNFPIPTSRVGSGCVGYCKVASCSVRVASCSVRVASEEKRAWSFTEEHLLETEIAHFIKYQKNNRRSLN